MNSRVARLSKLADDAIKSGVGTEEFYTALVEFLPPEIRKQVGLALNLDREFSAFVRRTGDAIEWLLEQQAVTDEPINLAESQIVQHAATNFGVTPEGIAAAFQGNRSPLIKYLALRGLLAATRMVE